MLFFQWLGFVRRWSMASTSLCLQPVVRARPSSCVCSKEITGCLLSHGCYLTAVFPGPACCTQPQSSALCLHCCHRAKPNISTSAPRNGDFVIDTIRDEGRGYLIGVFSWAKISELNHSTPISFKLSNKTSVYDNDYLNWRVLAHATLFFINRKN